MFKSLLKFIKDSNVESDPGFLTLFRLGIGCGHNWGNCSSYPKLATCKNWEFLKHVNVSIFNLQVWTGLDNSEKIQNHVGPNRQPHYSDGTQTAPTVFGQRPPPPCFWIAPGHFLKWLGRITVEAAHSNNVLC
jgi:hypothetical protein